MARRGDSRHAMICNRHHPVFRAVVTLAVGGIGAAIGWLVGAPIWILLGPALAVSMAGLAGVAVEVDGALRDFCFVAVGLTVGAGFDADAVAVMGRWPLAFVVMVVLVLAILVACRMVLVRFFGFDARSALLASAPGHLSFVIAVASETGADVARISVTQSVRLLALTLVVPFAAMAMGVDMQTSMVREGPAIGVFKLLVLAIAAVGLGNVFARLKVPAPLLMGAMAVSAIGHLSGLTLGAVPGWLILPAYLVLGCLIGTRFGGITPAALASGAGAGLAVTVVAAGLSAIASVPVAWALGMPMAHLLVAFAPGGLETMIAIGALLVVVPGFVAACHIMRLMALSVFLPVMLARSKVAPVSQSSSPTP